MCWLSCILFLIAKVNYIHMDITNNTEPLNYSSNDKFYFCRSLFIYENFEDSYKAIFHDITGYKQLEKLIPEFTEIPLKLIRLNKNLLSKFMNPSDIKDVELHFHGSVFYQSLEEMFSIFPDEMSFEIVDKHLQTLMISILTYGTRNKTFGYTALELKQCFQINDYAAQSISIFGDLSVIWLKASSPGFTRYINLRKILKLTKAILNSGPSNSCNECLRRLSLGCSNPDKCFTSNKGQKCLNICNNYCINVLRGCLAPLFLFTPKQLTYLNEKLIWSHSNQIHFDDLRYLLNATTVYHLIRKGIVETKENSDLIKTKLDQFCRKSKPHSLQATQILFNSLDENEQLLDKKGERYLKFNSEDYKKLDHFVKKLEKDLNAYFRDRSNKNLYMRNIELLYCSQENNKHCWNGSFFSPYTREVPEFTVDGQSNNPEVKITSNDLKLGLIKEKNVIRKEKAEGKNIAKVNATSNILSNNFLNNLEMSHKDDLFTSESSGIRPPFTSTDFELIPPNYFRKTDNRQEGITSDVLSNRIVVQGCFVDDEDCELHFPDSSVNSNVNENHNENESFYSSYGRLKDNKIQETTNVIPLPSVDISNSTTLSSLTNSRIQKNIGFNKKLSSVLIYFAFIFTTDLIHLCIYNIG
ncbi:hypothetical protein MN116_002110 [Schistosoma mekongi]|uniref:Glypican n=1 Tax=Schistosoma mekongi TaxID=38744 RepID=A0AAE1ZKS3_SCHME|nr:hypothetical protein MN116_002110 [Schistosoma mekongi]